MTARAEQSSEAHTRLRLVDDQAAIDARALRSVRTSVPNVRPPPKWVDDGQGWPCFFLGLFIVCELAVLAWEVFGRFH